MSTSQAQLGTAPIKKLLFSLAVPTVTAQIVNLLYNLVDRMFIGHIPGVGDMAFAGVSVCFPIIIFIAGFSNLMALGGSPRASIAEGRGDSGEAEQIMGNSFTLLLITSLVLTTIFLTFSTQILYAFGASDQTIVYGQTYLNIYAIGTISVQMTLGMNAFITAQGFTKISMKTVLIGAITNLILDPILIFGCGMGVAGAALATIISQTISAVWVLRFLLGKQTKWNLRLPNLRLRKSVVCATLALGVAPFIMTSTESLIAVCFNTSLYNYVGDIAVGAYGAMASVMQIIFIPLQGFSQGAQPITSYNYGARLPDRVRASFSLLFKSAFCYSFVVWSLVMIFPRTILGVFLSSPEMLEYAVWGLRIYLAGMGLMGMQLACQQTFIALGDAKTSLFLALLRKIVLLVPLIYILPNFFENKALGVLLAAPTADFIAITTTVVLFHKRFKIAMKEIEDNP